MTKLNQTTSASSSAAAAIDITYDPTLSGLTAINVQAAIDEMNYTAMTIASFTNNVNSAEKGSTVNSVTLSWTYNTPTVTVTSQSINQGVGTITVGTLTKALTSLGLTSTTTWTLTASNGTETPTANSSVTFYSKRYWGASADDSLTTAEILTLDSNEYVSSRSTTKTFDCSGGKYIWICYPTSLGTATFTVGGFVTSFNVSTVSHTNASGFTEDYYTYRSVNLQYSSSVTVVVS